MKRAIDCGCGHHIEAKDDEQLFKLVRRHVDDEHPELNLTRADIEKMIGDRGYDLPDGFAQNRRL